MGRGPTSVRRSARGLLAAWVFAGATAAPLIPISGTFYALPSGEPGETKISGIKSSDVLNTGKFNKD